MRRIPMLLIGVSLIAATGSAPRYSTAADLSVGIRVGEKYHGDRLRFRHRPRMTVVPGSRVYYSNDSRGNLYRYGNYYYGYDSGRWYRSSSYRGPWIYVHGRIVPRAVYTVPTEYRGNWRADYNYWSRRDYDPDWENYRGNGVDRQQDMTPINHDRNMTH